MSDGHIIDSSTSEYLRHDGGVELRDELVVAASFLADFAGEKIKRLTLYGSALLGAA